LLFQRKGKGRGNTFKRRKGGNKNRGDTKKGIFSVGWRRLPYGAGFSKGVTAGGRKRK